MPFQLVAKKRICTKGSRDKGCVADIKECYYACKEESDIFIYANSRAAGICERGTRSCQCQRGDGNGQCDQMADPHYDLYTNISKLVLCGISLP